MLIQEKTEEARNIRVRKKFRENEIIALIHITGSKNWRVIVITNMYWILMCKVVTIILILYRRKLKYPEAKLHAYSHITSKGWDRFHSISSSPDLGEILELFAKTFWSYRIMARLYSTNSSEVEYRHGFWPMKCEHTSCSLLQQGIKCVYNLPHTIHRHVEMEPPSSEAQ